MKDLKLPSTLPDLLLHWYSENARDLPWRRDTDPYHVWLSEIMLQQTRVEAVKSYYLRFLEEVPSIRHLAELDDDRLMKLWEGLGYYNRARNLRKAARIIVAEHDGMFPHAHAEILRLPGIGPYTAGAIASICFGELTPAVDGNVLRVIARVAEIEEQIETPAAKTCIAGALAAIYPRNDAGAFTQSLMELGATVCIPNGSPKCDVCPLQDICQAHRHATADRLPLKKERKERKIEERTVLLLFHADKIAIRKRADTGLLGGMWELPNEPEARNSAEAMELAGCWGAEPKEVVASYERIHVFTHKEWHMRCYQIRCAETPDRFLWTTFEELEERHALPAAFRICLREQSPEPGGNRP